MPAHRTILRSCLICAAACCPVAAPACATVQFQKVFIENYLAEHPDREFVEFVRTEAKCFTCHQGSKNRKNHNAFGAELSKLLDGKADRNDAAKILAALTEASRTPADPAAPNGPTFADRIAAGKLPAGELQDARREPGE